MNYNLQFDFATFVQLIDNVYDEIFIWDDQYTIIYANKACYRHYGLTPEELVGKTLKDFVGKENYWTPSSVPYIYKEKVPVIQKQKTLLGIDIITISIPIINEINEVKYIVQSVRDDDESLYAKLSPIQVDSEENNINDDKIICKSRLMKDVLQYAKKIAKVKAPVLILGETGTGKSLLAKYIHNKSERKDKPFVCVNMASLSPTIFESELFGYKKGSFTGANPQGKIGFFEMAQGGTIFLDEIGEIPFDLQAKFLHVLQEDEFIPLGSVAPVKLDSRVICATNCDLAKMVEAGKFREDLYHRLNVIEITIPPLRKRSEDIQLLASHFLNIFNKKYEKSAMFSDKYFASILQYPWKGNVRELSNVIERGVLSSNGNYIEVTDFPDSFFSMNNTKYNVDSQCGAASYDELMAEYEKKIISTAYEKYKSSRKVAEALNISQSKASRLKQKYL